MASSKKRRKLSALEQKQKLAGLPPRPPKDGDRRRRGGPNVREALRIKALLRRPPPLEGDPEG